MPKFSKSIDELNSKFEKWLYVLRNLNRLQERPEKLQERVFEKLFHIAEIAKFNQLEWMSYEDSLKYYRDLKNSFDTAREEGKLQGIKEGLKVGKEEGLKEGLKVGKEEGIKEAKLEMAKMMLNSGESIEKVAIYTGLTIEQLQKII
jgi:flagellar biosynthesis/type III secretory pathway protein FliH